MLVIATAGSGDGLLWSGRRHDDDGPGAVHDDGFQSLFDIVFGALHDGEQVAVGARAPLGVAPADTSGPDFPAAEPASPQIETVRALMSELGRWRPWTAVSTSLPRWRATTSILVWETETPDDVDLDLDGAVEAFYDLVHAGASQGVEAASDGTVNLAAVAAQRAGLSIDAAQVSEPVLRIPGTTVSSAAAGLPAG